MAARSEPSGALPPDAKCGKGAGACEGSRLVTGLSLPQMGVTFGVYCVEGCPSSPRGVTADEALLATVCRAVFCYNFRIVHPSSLSGGWARPRPVASRRGFGERPVASRPLSFGVSQCLFLRAQVSPVDITFRPFGPGEREVDGVWTSRWVICGRLKRLVSLARDAPGT